MLSLAADFCFEGDGEDFLVAFSEESFLDFFETVFSEELLRLPLFLKERRIMIQLKMYTNTELNYTNSPATRLKIPTRQR